MKISNPPNLAIHFEDLSYTQIFARTLITVAFATITTAIVIITMTNQPKKT